MIIISDIHGCYKTMRKLLRKCPREDDVYLLGDMVDRGPDSRSVLEWARSSAQGCVMGNHDHMMVDSLTGGGQYDPGLWEHNGGDTTIESFGSDEVGEDLLNWIARLPPSIRVGKWMLSHTGHGHRRDISLFERIWIRDHPKYKDGLMRPYGHTPHHYVKADSRAMCIDTGCAYASRGYGVLTAIVVPDPERREFRIIQQEYSE